MRWIMLAMMVSMGCTQDEPLGLQMGGGGGPPPSVSTPGTDPQDMGTPDTSMTPSTNEEGLFTFLSQEEYRGWASSQGAVAVDPHGRSRAYLNPTLAGSLRAGDMEHPVDSTVVLDRFDIGGKLVGWSVMVKVDRGDVLDWYWYEPGDLEDASKFSISGVGAPNCVGCHLNGDDMIQGMYAL